VFLSYAHEPDDAEHGERVRRLWLFLRANGIDARLDLAVGEERLDWAQWTAREVRDAGFVLVVASPGYRLRAEGDAGPGEGRGVQWEARLIRDRFYADQDAGLREILPVVLPGCSASDIPFWLAPASATCYVISEFTVTGARALLRALTGRPAQEAPPLGLRPILGRAALGAETDQAGRGVLRTEVLVDAVVAPDQRVVTQVQIAGSLAGRAEGALPLEARRVWSALRLPAAEATDLIADAGRRLGRALFGQAAGQLVANMLFSLPPGHEVQVVLRAADTALELPVELVRLVTSGGVEVGPLGLLAGVAVSRRPSDGDSPQAMAPPAPARWPQTAAGPLKILAAVAAPDEKQRVFNLLCKGGPESPV
jgi:hypothetical protein